MKVKKIYGTLAKHNTIGPQGLLHLSLPGDTGGQFCSPVGLGDDVMLTNGL